MNSNHDYCNIYIYDFLDVANLFIKYIRQIEYEHEIPSGYLTYSHGKWPIEIDGLPITNGDLNSITMRPMV